MTSVAWPYLILAVLFLLVGLFFILGRDSVVAGSVARREQANKLRAKDRQLPPSTLTVGRAAGAGIALTVVGLLWLGLFIASLVP